jgi:hypothetical protein
MRLTQPISIQLFFLGGKMLILIIYLWVNTENYLFYFFLSMISIKSIKISILSCYVSVEEQTILIYTYFFPLKLHLNGQIFLSSSPQTLLRCVYTVKCFFQICFNASNITCFKHTFGRLNMSKMLDRFPKY